MKITEAIEILNGVIPSPDNKMVDAEHLPITQAWGTVKALLVSDAKPIKLLQQEIHENAKKHGWWEDPRRQNNRFHYVKNWDCPEFKRDALKKFSAKRSRSVFIDSMSDIGHWRPDWLAEVFQAMANNPQHDYIALTKTNLNALNRKIGDALAKIEGDFDLYIGKSITTQAQADAFRAENEIIDFLSIEPLLEPIDLKEGAQLVHTIIIGAETGNRKGKIKPDAEWVRSLVMQADIAQIGVFMKESLRSIMGADFRQDRLPWARLQEETTQKGDQKQ